MAVAIEVLEGRRPKIPADLPPVFKKLIKRYCACVCFDEPQSEVCSSLSLSLYLALADAGTGTKPSAPPWRR
jgi:hypothetical protein